MRSKPNNTVQLIHTKFATNVITFLPTLKNLIGNVNASNSGGQQLFYTLCYKFVASNLLSNNSTLNTLQTVLDGIIELERMVFSKSRMLNFILQFLITHSDGTNLQCLFNIQLLDYFLNKYNL
ncbi:ORF-118 [Buzura suppressaria nucleopolyhedrovirus]|uniref:ORF-118 n=1 Tax=Buzura suppressaria nuclear polyhedrosis virus TaxID=74320 RepID=W5VSE9_NPVBS|nr:ORF-118 [Buzura suppressaria nucleopolyhedrovirus]AHH82707.1 ORF-118 [Buzura suppressaria nucleopolyhedrovirus]AKN91091.1 ORF-121 [Buzura suppressaria nucleopolyhedrovirus]QYF10583.1 hypothetical protein [Buzura suppressaria nucleopolyhedrovirus]